MPLKLLPTAEVLARTCMSKSTLYAKMSRGEFPKPVPVGERVRGWPEHEIDAWIEERIAQARGEEHNESRATVG